jgi:hypothetical protein
MIKDIIKYASFFKTNLSEDAVNSKIEFDDQGSLKDIKYHVTISSFIRGIVVYVRINNFQQMLEITENVKIPLEIPSPLGFIGGVISADNMTKTEFKMNVDFKIDISFGFFGSYNILEHKVAFVADPNHLSQTSNNINDYKYLILIGLIKADGIIKNEEIEQFREFMKLADVPSDKQNYFISLLNSNDTVNLDFTKIKNNSLSVSLIDIMIQLAKRDGEIHVKEFEYIMWVCECVNMDTEIVINKLEANYLAVKYFFKNLAVETSELLIVSFNDSKNKAQFYKNNRLFIFDNSNNILAKGGYLIGGKKIVLDSGKSFESNFVLENLIKTVM